MSKFETVEDAVRASAAAATGTGGFSCIHCGKAPIKLSLFCSVECRDECLVSCGSKSTLGA